MSPWVPFPGLSPHLSPYCCPGWGCCAACPGELSQEHCPRGAAGPARPGRQGKGTEGGARATLPPLSLLPCALRRVEAGSCGCLPGWGEPPLSLLPALPLPLGHGLAAASVLGGCVARGEPRVGNCEARGRVPPRVAGPAVLPGQCHQAAAASRPSLALHRRRAPSEGWLPEQRRGSGPSGGGSRGSKAG